MGKVMTLSIPRRDASSRPEVNSTVRYLRAADRHEGVLGIGDWTSVHQNTVEVEVEISNGRGPGDSAALDAQGHSLVSHRSEFTDFRDDAGVERFYIPEVRELVADLTEAAAVFPTHHFIRWGKAGDIENGYAPFLHGDKPVDDPRGFTDAALARLRIDLRGDNWDFAWYNTWQPIDHEAQQNPLVFVDAQTVEAGDMVPYYYVGNGEKNLETSLLPNSRHRFSYYPNMRTDEIVLFKQLDTRPGRAVTCVHSSFVDPSAPESAPPRRSVEVRWLCAFPVT